jgi:hypothetical protein
VLDCSRIANLQWSQPFNEIHKQLAAAFIAAVEFTTAVKHVASESAKATATELIDAAKLNQPGSPSPIQPLPAADLEKQFEEPGEKGVPNLCSE